MISESEETKKSFKCPYCPSTFSYKGNLPRHISKIHEGKKHATLDTKQEENSNIDGGEFRNRIGSFVFIWIDQFRDHCSCMIQVDFRILISEYLFGD